MEEKDFYKGHFGPVVHYYLMKLDSYIRYLDDGHTTFLFISRAGIRIKKLYDIYLEKEGLTKPKNVDILWASRYLICKSYWVTNWDIVGKIVKREYYSLSAKGILKAIYETERAVPPVSFDRIENMPKEKLFKRIIKGVGRFRHVNRYLKSENALFSEYIESKIDKFDRVVIIDSGWQGTAHEIFSKIYKNKKWCTLLFGRIWSRQADNSIKPDVHGLIFESHIEDTFDYFDSERPSTAFTLHRHIIEHLFEPNIPSVEKLVKNVNQIEPVDFEKMTLALNEDGDSGYDGIIEYLREIGTSDVSEVMGRFSETMKVLSERLVFPRIEDVFPLGHVVRSRDFGLNYKVSVLLEKKDRFPGDSPKSRINDSLWSQGQIAVEYPITSRTKQQARVEDGFYGRFERRRLLLARNHLTQDNVLADVAIITRTKDRPILLVRASESVAKQTFQNYVWVVVNDGGNLESVLQVVDRCAVDKRKVLVVNNQESIGMEAASNVGISRTKSKYLVIHDDDDSWEPTFLEKSILFLESRDGEKYGGVITGTQYVSEEIVDGGVRIHAKRPYNEWIRNITIMEMANGNLFAPIAFLYRREVYDRIGGYNERLPVLGDWDFNLKFLHETDIGVLTEHLANYHHRDVGQVAGDYSNSVVGGISKHIEYDAIVRNDFFRKNGLDKGGLVQLGHILKAIRQQTQTIVNKGQRLSREEKNSFYQFKDLERRYFLGSRRLGRLREKLFGLRIPADFNEKKYLNEYKDVKREVRAGKFKSGYEHFIKYGMNEGRKRFNR